MWGRFDDSAAPEDSGGVSMWDMEVLSWWRKVLKATGDPIGQSFFVFVFIFVFVIGAERRRR